MFYNIDGEMINIDAEDITMWDSLDIGEITSVEDCLGMILVMIDNSDYMQDENIPEETKMMLDDLYQYAELGLHYLREQELEYNENE